MEKKEKTRVISDATLDRYLCAILILSESRSPIRSVDVAQYLDCSRACVSMALKEMTGRGLAQVERQGALALTDAGLSRARARRERLDYFTRLLTRCGVAPTDAELEAHAITHVMSCASFDALRNYLAERGVTEQSPSI